MLDFDGIRRNSSCVFLPYMPYLYYGCNQSAEHTERSQESVQGALRREGLEYEGRTHRIHGAGGEEGTEKLTGNPKRDSLGVVGIGREL